MKIFYKYNGFTRSSELSTNFNGDYNTNYALLGSFDEDLWNLFGIFYVSESSSGESLEYVIEGFNEEGNGKTAPHEGATFEILRKMFGGIWKDVGSKEVFEALFKPQVERLTIKIVPNPELANDKDDIYTYLNPENRDILSCSKVLVVPIPKEEEIPQPDIDCIPTNVTFSKEYHTVKPHIITVSRNGGPFITFDLNSSDLDQDLYFRTMSSSISGDGLAFIDGRENLYDYIVRGVINEPIFGISVDGSISINKSPVYLENEKIIYNHIIIEAPYIIQEETNWLTFIPTKGAHPDSDKFYKLYGNKENDQITVYSCAYLTKDWNNLPYIPTKYLI